MTTNRVLTVLVTLTVIMQGVILYRQPRPPKAQPPVVDAPQGVFVELGDLPIRGSADAKTVLIEFSDYECPFCSRHATTVLPSLIERYVESGFVRYALANNPLPIHRNAEWLAHVAICAGKQGRYWEMHDRLFAEKPTPDVEVRKLSDGISRLDSDALDHCVKEPQPDLRVALERDKQLAIRLGLSGTPAFAVGQLEKDGRVRLEKIIRGAVALEVFSGVLDELLPKARPRS